MKQQPNLPRVALVGTGVVGRAILKAHVDACVPVCVADKDSESLRDAVNIVGDDSAWKIEHAEVGELPVVALIHSASRTESEQPWIVIESIAERLDVKRAFFQQAAMDFGDDAVLCSNTSTLRISDIADAVRLPSRVCGMHFFMPVYNRDAVEIVRTPHSSSSAIEVCVRHVDQINKTPLLVQDSPGFLVNRLLSPYLNQSLLLLGHGVTAQQIEQAALRYGMPLSPLELIDWIGTRTMFDAGRAFWQAFPNRLDPSPIVPALIKKKRGGRSTGAGLYDYDAGTRSVELAAETQEIVERYQLEQLQLTDDDVMHLLAIPMRIEAGIALSEGITESEGDFDIAMSGGLGYRADRGWLGFFESMGQRSIEHAIERWSPQFKSMVSSLR